MPDPVVQAFEARRPLLQHVADCLRDELAESIADANIPCSVTFHVATSAEFSSSAEHAGQGCPNPLSELADQLRGRLEFENLDDITKVEPLVGEHLSVVSKTWMNDATGKPPALVLQCAIPPQAKPDGWQNRSDVPALFELTLSVQERSAQLPSTVPVLLEVTSDDSAQPFALIMKGGGIKGLAYVGAAEELSQKYSFNWFVGTSAGAVAAVLLGAGYSVDELRQILRSKDFRDFFDASLFGKWLNLVFHHGLHRADSFTSWLDTLLAQKLGSQRRVRLSDLPHRVTVFASQRGHRSLRFDSHDNDADAAFAVRCSMSIPIVFVPQSDQGLRAYDGGLQHNYPVDEILRAYPKLDFISLYLGPEIYQPLRQRFVFSDLISIWTEAADSEAISKYRDRTVVIDPAPIGTLDFGLTEDEKDYLLACGKAGALAHLDKDSEAYATAKRRRDELKLSVASARQTKKRQRRRTWLIGTAVTLVLFAVAGWWFYF